MDKRYAIIETLGAGATGTVYLARDTVLSRELAIKTGTDKELLRYEGVQLATHPYAGFPAVYDYAEIGEEASLYMEYVRGENLRDRTARVVRYSEDEIEDILIEAAALLAVLHGAESPCVYGDVKPENFIMQDDGTLRLVDFGTVEEIAHPRRKTGFTPRYAAPERAAGILDVRSDIYALGRMIEELDTQHGARSKAFKRVIARCTQPHAENRYADAPELLEDATAL